MNDQNHVEFDGVRYDAVETIEGLDACQEGRCDFYNTTLCARANCSQFSRQDERKVHWVKSANQPAAAMPATPPKKKRVYSEPTKTAWTVRCLDAENSLRDTERALTAETQGRAKAELAANRLQDEVDRLRCQRFTERILFVGIIVGMIAGAWFLIGGAQ